MSRGQIVALIWGVTMLIYMSPLLLTRTSGDWDFWYIWDDRTNFVENEVLQSSMSLQTLYEMFTMVKLNVYEPLGWLLKYFIVQTVGLDAWWVRMVSVVIHFGAGFILARVSGLVLDIDFILNAFKQPGRTALDWHQRREQSCLHFHACCVSAAVFLVHPLYVEVVAWPSAQPYTLAAFFSFWALFVHVKRIHQNLSKLVRRNPTDVANDSGLLLNVLLGGAVTSSSLLSSGLYLCALLSKSASLLLPAGFFLVDVWVYLQLYLQLFSAQRTSSVKQIRLYAANKLVLVAILLVFVSVTGFSNIGGGRPDMVSLSVGERVLKALNSPIWILLCIVWPSNLRPHYQIRPGDLSIGNPDCLLSLATTIFVLAIMIWNSWHRGVSKHTLSLVFFITMLLPVSGLVQHGIVAAGANRYAYLSTVVVVPYGGWMVAYYLFRGSCFQGESHRQTAPAWDIPERNVLRNSRHMKESRKTTLLCWSKLYAWSAYFILIGTLLSISTALMSHCRNEDSLFEYSLRVDPSDWKILGQRAEYLLHAGRCTPDITECKHHWILASEFSPHGTLKSQLYRLHLLVAIGDVDRACDGYIMLLRDYSGNSSVHNNAAVCFVIHGMLDEARREFLLARDNPDIDSTMDVHARNFEEFIKWEAERNEDIGFLGRMTY